MKTTAFFTALALLFATTLAANAQVTPRRSDKARIQQGVRSGHLTPAEVARVRAQQAEAQQARQAARADGTVTPTERAVIRKEEKQADRAVYRQKHDAQTRH